MLARPLRTLVPVLLLALAGCPRRNGATPDGGVDARAETPNAVAAGTDCSPDRWCKSAPELTGNGLHAVWGSVATDLWVIGGVGAIFHSPDGKSWTRIDSPTKAPLFGIHGASPVDVWAVGDAGTILHWDGHAWSASPSGVRTPLLAAWAHDPGDA